MGRDLVIQMAFVDHHLERATDGVRHNPPRRYATASRKRLHPAVG